MPAAKLPKKLHSRLDELAARVRRIRTVRALSRAAFVLPVAALVCVLAERYLGLRGWLRGGLFVGWVLLGLRELRNVWRARTAAVDLEAIASAVEEEFPRLAQRITTAVELADHADESNGAPALIDEVILDADSRARKLELAAAFPAGGVIASFLTAMALLGAMLAPALIAPRGGEHLRRFFLPWYTPRKTVLFKALVTTPHPAVKRGDPVTLSAYTEATRAEAQLPAAAPPVV